MNRQCWSGLAIDYRCPPCSSLTCIDSAFMGPSKVCQRVRLQGTTRCQTRGSATPHGHYFGQAHFGWAPCMRESGFSGSRTLRSSNFCWKNDFSDPSTRLKPPCSCQQDKQIFMQIRVHSRKLRPNEWSGVPPSLQHKVALMRPATGVPCSWPNIRRATLKKAPLPSSSACCTCLNQGHL
jgi:hypothetical protein